MKILRLWKNFVRFLIKENRRGAIDFDFEESKIILNEFGKPIEIKPYERAIANRIIEEFMLVSNETSCRAYVLDSMYHLYIEFMRIQMKKN